MVNGVFYNEKHKNNSDCCTFIAISILDFLLTITLQPWYAAFEIFDHRSSIIVIAGLSVYFYRNEKSEKQEAF